MIFSLEFHSKINLQLFCLTNNFVMIIIISNIFTHKCFRNNSMVYKHLSRNSLQKEEYARKETRKTLIGCNVITKGA